MVIPSSKYAFDKETQTFSVDGRAILFGTEHELLNIKTKARMKFEFSHSTGSEWDPKTIWVYKSVDTVLTYFLNISNEDVTPEHMDAYLQAKLQNS